MGIYTNTEKLPKLFIQNLFQDDYADSKMYPMIPRYFMLKDMIRDVMRDPAFVEICHEATSGVPLILPTAVTSTAADKTK